MGGAVANENSASFAGSLHYQSTLHVQSKLSYLATEVPTGWGRARSPSPVAAAEQYSVIASGLVSARYC